MEKRKNAAPSTKRSKNRWLNKPAIQVALIAAAATILAAFAPVTWRQRAYVQPNQNPITPITVQGTGNNSTVVSSPVQVQNSPGAVVQSAVQSSNVVQIGNVNLGPRRLKLAEARILTNTLAKIGNVEIEVVSSTGGDSPTAATEMCYILKQSGIKFQTRTIVGAVITGITVIDKREKIIGWKK